MYKNKKISGEELEKVEYEDALSMEAAQNEDYFHWCQAIGEPWMPVRTEIERLQNSLVHREKRLKAAIGEASSAKDMGRQALVNVGDLKDWAVRELNDLWVKVEHLRTAIRWLSIAVILLGIGQIATSVARIIH